MRPELSCRGRWHYHGRLYITDSFKFHLLTIPYLELHYNVKIKSITNNDAWTDYCLKEEYIMQPSIGHRYVLKAPSPLALGKIKTVNVPVKKRLNSLFN